MSLLKYTLLLIFFSLIASKTPNDDCKDLVPHCMTCKASSPSECAQCEEYYALIGGKCVEEDCKTGLTRRDHCIECDPKDKIICIACEKGYHLAQFEKACMPGDCMTGAGYKIEHCVKCQYGYEELCEECEEGFVPDKDKRECLEKGGDCIKGEFRVDHCVECDSSEITKCVACEPRYHLDKYNNKCPFGDCKTGHAYKVQHCVKCVKGMEDYCEECESGFKPSEDKKECLEG